MKRTLGMFAGAIAAALLSACGNPTPITSGTPAPPTPFPPQVSSEYPLLTAAAQVTGISKGLDGSVWFTETAANKIGRLSSTAVVTEFPIVTPGAAPLMITNGPNGALWFTESGTNAIGYLPLSGTGQTTFTLPNPLSRPWGIVTGPDGNLWVTDPGANEILSVTTGGVATAYPLDHRRRQPDGHQPRPERAGLVPRGGVDKIGAITPGAASRTPVPTEYRVTARRRPGRRSSRAPMVRSGSPRARATSSAACSPTERWRRKPA